MTPRRPARSRYRTMKIPANVRDMLLAVSHPQPKRGQMITTSYGNWTTRVTPYNMTLESQVADALDSYEPTEDQLNAVCAAYRAVINDALPPQVVLAGNEFYGPAYDEDCQFDGYPLDEDGRLDFTAIVDGVDFWKIADPILNPTISGDLT